MVGQVCTAVDAAVAAVTGVQIGLESFGLGLLHHVFEEHNQKWCQIISARITNCAVPSHV